MIRSRMGAVENVNKNGINAKTWWVEAVDGHIRGRKTQITSALFAMDHRPVDPVPVSKHCSCIAGATFG